MSLTNAAAAAWRSAVNRSTAGPASPLISTGLAGLVGPCGRLVLLVVGGLTGDEVGDGGVEQIEVALEVGECVGGGALRAECSSDGPTRRSA